MYTHTHMHAVASDTSCIVHTWLTKQSVDTTDISKECIMYVAKNFLLGVNGIDLVKTERIIVFISSD